MTITLVTGATRGIGCAVAQRLVEAGQIVYLGARDMPAGTGVAAAIGATPIQLDATNADSIAAAVERLRDEVGVLDVLVNNAGIAGEQRRPGEATLADMRGVFETNVFGVAAVIDAFTPLLEASAAPVVVNVSSGVGSLTLNAAPDSRWTMLAYPMSKAALNMLTIQYARAFPPLAGERHHTGAHSNRVHRPPRRRTDHRATQGCRNADQHRRTGRGNHCAAGSSEL